MTSPSHISPRNASLAVSPRTGLLPSPFSHSDEALSELRPHDSGGPDPLLYDDYPEPQDESLLPPSTFAPFFTMIKDAETGETYHPSTYYVFEDDEPDVLTTAALHALEAGAPNAVRDAEAKALSNGTAREEERYVLINMGQDGTNVAGARSLAPSWAVTNAYVRSAPTFDDGEGGDSDGFMLLVEGLSSGAPSITKAKTSKERQDQAGETFEEARRQGAGNTITAMENIAQGMIAELRTLDMIATAD